MPASKNIAYGSNTG